MVHCQWIELNSSVSFLEDTLEDSCAVLIAGAGPTGLVMAIELARRGIACRIVDKVLPRPYSESRAEGIHAKTLDIFERQGILPAILKAGKVLHGFSFFAEGRALGRITFATLDSPHPYAILLPQSEVERLLLEHLATLGVQVERPTEVIGMQQDADGTSVQIRDQYGTEQTLRARYLIAADGGQSTIRHLLQLDFPGHRLQGAYVMDADMDIAIPLPTDDGTFVLGPHGFLVLGLRPDGLWRLALSLPQKDTRMGREQPTKERMQQILDTDFRDLGIHLKSTSWSSAFFLSSRMVSNIRRGRIFLVGDAAHIHSPVGGQGMNTGIQDAVNLAWKLALCVQHEEQEPLLASYHAERYPVMKRLIATTNASTVPLLVEQPLLVHARNLLLRVVTHIAALNTQLISSFTGFEVHYRHSPILADLDGGRGVHAGDYAPDVTELVTLNQQFARFADLWATDARHQLLCFPESDTVPSDITSLQECIDQHVPPTSTTIRPWIITQQPDLWYPNVVFDPNGHAAKRFGAQKGDVFLLRPDGYIGMTGQWASLLKKPHYLSHLVS